MFWAAGFDRKSYVTLKYVEYGSFSGIAVHETIFKTRSPPGETCHTPGAILFAANNSDRESPGA